MVNRRRVSQHAQPAEGVNLFVFADGAARCAGPANAMKAVAAGNEIAGDLVLLNALGAGGFITHAGAVGVKVMHRDLGGLINSGQTGSLARIHQVPGDFGLAIHHDLLAAGQRLHVDAVALALEEHVKTAVHQAFLVHARAHAGLVKQVHADLLQHAGTNAAEHVVGALALDQDGVYAGLVKQLPEQQTGRAAANDGYLGALNLHTELAPVKRTS